MGIRKEINQAELSDDLDVWSEIRKYRIKHKIHHISNWIAKIYASRPKRLASKL